MIEQNNYKVIQEISLLTSWSNLKRKLVIFIESNYSRSL